MKTGKEIAFTNLSSPIELKQLNDVINYMLSFVNGFGTGYIDTVNARTGIVLYEATTAYGIYSDGSIAATNKNSVTFSDSYLTRPYKRLGVYVRTPFGIMRADMAIDRVQGYNHPSFGDYQGGIVFPTGDSSSGATLNYLVKLSWCARHADGKWTFQVTDTGWINLGVGYVSVSNYTGNKDVAITSNTVTWNQRHNIYYSVYKIVGYTE